MELVGMEQEKLTKEQLQLIEKSKEYKLDVHKMLQQGFDWLQINEIVKGYENGVLSSIYSYPEFDFLQMEQIRLGLMDQLSVDAYAKKEYDHLVMREIRLSMKDGMDLLPYVNEGFSGAVLQEIRQAMKQHIDLMEYAKKGFDENQLHEIRIAIAEGLPMEQYFSIKWFGAQLNQIRLGIENKVDISIYATGEYNWLQMQEIRLGLQEHLDISFYCKSLLHWKQMEQIRLGLEHNLDVSRYAQVRYSANQMQQLRCKLEEEQEQHSLEALHQAYDDLNQEEVNREAQIIDTSNSINETDTLLEELKKGTPIPIDCGIVYLALDEMSATIELQETKNGAYQDKDIVEQLYQVGIKHGLLYQNIKKILKEKKYHVNVLIAQGKEPENGKDGYYNFLFRTVLPSVPKQRDDGSVDFYDMDMVETVKDGQKIVQYTPATAGKYGYTVTGELLIPTKGQDKPPLKGKGVTMSKDRKEYYAACNGKIEVQDDTITVSKILTIENNVDYGTGNVFFDGDILIQGDVLTGFSVQATGSIQVSGHIEGACLFAGQNVIAKGGMNGGNKGKIVAGRGIFGSFFEETILIATQQIAANYILNCSVETHDTVVISGYKGLIAGGNIKAINGLQVYTLGNVSQVPTWLQIGVDKELMQEYQQKVQEQDKVKGELDLLEKGKKDYEEKADLTKQAISSVYDKIVMAIKTKQEEKDILDKQVNHQLELIERGKKGRATIRGTAYPGVKVIVNMKEIVLTTPHRGVYFGINNGKSGMYRLFAKLK